MSPYGVVQESYIARLCPGRSDVELDGLIEYIEVMNQQDGDDSTLWHATVRYEVHMFEPLNYM